MRSSIRTRPQRCPNDVETQTRRNGSAYSLPTFIILAEHIFLARICESYQLILLKISDKSPGPRRQMPEYNFLTTSLFFRKPWCHMDIGKCVPVLSPSPLVECHDFVAVPAEPSGLSNGRVKGTFINKRSAQIDNRVPVSLGDSRTPVRSVNDPFPPSNSRTSNHYAYSKDKLHRASRSS